MLKKQKMYNRKATCHPDIRGLGTIMIRLGCDLDDCIVDTSSWVIDFLNKKYKRNDKLENKLSYNLEEVYPDLDKSIITNSVAEAVSMTQLPIIQNSIEVLNSYSTTLPLFIISHRPGIVFDSTKTMLLKLGLKYFCLEFSTNNGKKFESFDLLPNKSEIINRENINIFIEDRVDTAQDILDKTRCIILLFKRPWNINKINESKRLFYVETWNEIEYILKVIKIINEAQIDINRTTMFSVF